MNKDTDFSIRSHRAKLRRQNRAMNRLATKGNQGQYDRFNTHFRMKPIAKDDEKMLKITKKDYRWKAGRVSDISKQTYKKFLKL